MTSNKSRRYVGGTTGYISEDSSVTKPPQETPVNGVENDIPVLVELSQASQDKHLITFTPGRLMQETMSVWRIDLPSGDCSRINQTGKKVFQNITVLYTEGYRLFGIYGVSGNVGWAYLSNWVEVE